MKDLTLRPEISKIRENSNGRYHKTPHKRYSCIIWLQRCCWDHLSQGFTILIHFQKSMRQSKSWTCLISWWFKWFFVSDGLSMTFCWRFWDVIWRIKNSLIKHILYDVLWNDKAREVNQYDVLRVKWLKRRWWYRI